MVEKAVAPSAEDNNGIGDLLRQILSEATALKHVGTRTTKPYAESIETKVRLALDLLDAQGG